MTDAQAPLEQPGGSGGIFLVKGMRLGFPAGGIVISLGQDGETELKATTHVAHEVYATWLEIAFGHLNSAQAAHERLRAVWTGEDADAKGTAMLQEFEASLQCVVAAAIALDAFYAWVRPEVTITQRTIDSWRKNRTARHRQMTEVFKQAFLVGPKSSKSMQGLLGELFKWRGWAVHPSADMRAPVWYEELQVGTDWRLTAFRAANAQALMQIALSVIVQLLSRPRPKWPKLVELCNGSLSLDELVMVWEDRYGLLYEREAEPSQEDVARG